MQVFVTGGTGFVGTHLVPRLLEAGHDVTVLHRPGLPVPEGLDCDIVEGDLLQPDTLDIGDAEAVVHLAAQSSPKRCEQDPVGAIQANVLGTQHILRKAEDNGARFVFMSTGQVYAPSTTPIAESHPVGPLTRYGATKLAAEVLVRNAHAREALETVVLRAFNMYGPGQSGPFVVPDIIEGARKGQIHLRSGKPVRDFLYVGDAAELITKAVQAPNAAGQTFNVASGKSVSIEELAKTAAEIAGVGVSFDDEARGFKEADELHVDISHAKQILGWRPRTELREGLSRALQA